MTSPVDIRPDHLGIVQGILREHLPAGVKVWVFGSRVNWTTKDSSDLDLALEGKSQLIHKVLGALKDAFEDSALPYTVDVVDLNRIGDSFRQIVESQRLPLDGDDTGQPLPNGWREVTLGEICEFQAGSVFKLQYQGKASGHYPFIKVRDMNLSANEVRINESTNWIDQAVAKKIRAKPIPKRSIVFAKIGEALKQNRLRMTVRPTIVDNNMMGAIPKTDIVEPGFLFYGMHQFDFGEIASGTALPYLTMSELANLPMFLPPLPEQQVIANVLGTLDDKIELNRRMNETLEAMARALFKSWFVDFDPVRAKRDGRWRQGESLPGLPADLYDLFPDRFVDSELGEIPEGWDVKELGHVTGVVGGSTPSTKITEYWDGGTHCWATPKNLSALSSSVLLDTERKITDAGLRQIGSGLLPKGTLLLSSRAPIGYVAVSEEPVAINQGFIAMPPRKGTSNLFMLYWCSEFHDEIVNHANGSTFLEISKSNFRRIPLVVPAEAAMTAFDRIASTLHEHVVSNESESRALAIQRDALLPKLVSGELAVGTE